MDIKEQILVALGLNKAEETIKLEWQSKGEDGTIYVSTAEELEAGVDISVLTEDGTTIPLPAGTYKTDTGVSFRVSEEGVVDEVLVSETEEKDTEEEMTEDVNLEEKEDDDDYEEEADVADWKGMEKRIENLEIAVAKLKEAKVGGDDEVEEMSEETEEPSTNPKSIKTTEVVEFSVEELKAENEKLKAELAATPADEPINTNKFSSEKPRMSKAAYDRLSKRERILMNL
tara:strand:- start:1362 stop:2051 length:690 start_codon:yes stop_codon:yes gene_type:complete